MASVKIIDQSNKEVGDITLAPEVFEVEVKPEILHMAVRSHLAAIRSGTVGVKGWHDVRGGGKKPFRQKGTGRARAGSTRSPIWRGGAVIFGPQARDYSFKINRKVRALAMKMALSSRMAENSVKVVSDLALPEVKTKKFSEMANGLGLKKALIVVAEMDNNLRLSARNIPGITVVTDDTLNVYDILNHHQLVLTPKAVEKIEARLK